MRHTYILSLSTGRWMSLSCRIDLTLVVVNFTTQDDSASGIGRRSASRSPGLRTPSQERERRIKYRNRDLRKTETVTDFREQNRDVNQMFATAKRCLDRIGRQPPMVIFIESLLFAIGIGFLDFGSGYEVSMFVFYGLPILMVAWWCGRRRALFLAAMCAIIWWIADSMTGHFYRHEWIRAWEPIARFGYFGFVAFAGSALKRQHTAVHSRIALLEHSQRLEREIIEISEREQQRIGRDLHDGLCQYFAAVGCAAASLKSDLAHAGMNEEAALAAELSDVVEQGVVQIRDLARGLMPVKMCEAGLSAALQQLATSVSRLQNVTCTLIVDDDEIVHEHSVATHLYRIAQEAIHNAIRHGGAHKIQIQLGRNGSRAVLRVRDDGLGISRTKAEANGMGLNIMRYRARHIAGELRVIEPAAGGTEILCTFPPLNQGGDHHG